MIANILAVIFLLKLSSKIHLNAPGDNGFCQMTAEYAGYYKKGYGKVASFKIV